MSESHSLASESEGSLEDDESGSAQFVATPPTTNATRAESAPEDRLADHIIRGMAKLKISVKETASLTSPQYLNTYSGSLTKINLSHENCALIALILDIKWFQEWRR
jgi:hypothetical protein